MINQTIIWLTVEHIVTALDKSQMSWFLFVWILLTPSCLWRIRGEEFQGNQYTIEEEQVLEIMESISNGLKVAKPLLPDSHRLCLSPK
jgi:hypothetical protein